MKKIKAFHSGKSLDYSRIKALDGEVLRSDARFLLMELSSGGLIYYKDFGSIVFSGVSTDQVSNVLDELSIVEADILSTEEYPLTTNAGRPNVLFDEVKADEESIDVQHLLMLNLAQSVALDYFLEKSNALLVDLRVYSMELYEKGTTSVSKQELRKRSGELMLMKTNIVQKLFIFDTPDLVWEDEELSDLDEQMLVALSFVDRYKALQLNLELLAEKLTFFQELLRHKYSSKLEWIIILLILVEVVHLFVDRWIHN